MSAKLTLPTDSNERKQYPLLSGCLKYFPAALAGIARISKIGNDKHNPGLPLHHARGLSMDHGDCVVRHLIDTEDLLAALSRADTGSGVELQQQILNEASQMAWRALAYSQMLHERFGAPLAPGADERLLKNSPAARAEMGALNRAETSVSRAMHEELTGCTVPVSDTGLNSGKALKMFMELEQRYNTMNHLPADIAAQDFIEPKDD